MATVYTVRMTGKLADYIAETGLMQTQKPADRAEAGALAAWKEAPSRKVGKSAYYLTVTATRAALDIFTDHAKFILNMGEEADFSEAEIKAAATWLDRVKAAEGREETELEKFERVNREKALSPAFGEPGKVETPAPPRKPGKAPQNFVDMARLANSETAKAFWARKVAEYEG
ncbi:hypothetical protein [Kitasatospora sp. MBT66]|uniref:hypothetical protein n=1 Tax=Kitasatospora sp. MBT66 TaxID=1444769 RepID=UPI0005BDA1D9|nr:hypothetical protein [Kitasatospora sp. MBT66]